MTPSQEELTAKVGQKAVELLNIAQGYSKNVSPCTCSCCVAKLHAIAKWLAQHDSEIKNG